MQTSSLNSIRLHEYFLSRNINSKLLIGTNWHHGQIGYTTPDGKPCGALIILQFILGNQIDPTCLQTSMFKTMADADFQSYDDDDNDDEPSERSESDQTTIIILSVFLALTSTALCVILGFVLYRKYQSRKKIRFSI